MIRIGLVDDHELVRAGLRQLISTQADCLVVGEAQTAKQALDLVRNVAIDVLLLDVGLPQQSGSDALDAIGRRSPGTRVLVYSGYPEEHFALDLLRRGAHAYLRKDGDPTEVLLAIRALAAGGRFITGSVAGLLADDLQGPGTSAPHRLLTTRQFQIFLKLAQGAGIADIADSVSLSPKQVYTHRRHLMKKMQLATSSDLTYYALKHGILG